MSNDNKNNGGKTDYYNLPLPNKFLLKDILILYNNKEISCDDTINLIIEACPQTLNDLIEFKEMLPWQHEVFKACYALNERAKKNGGSALREINKIIYYALRGRKLNDNG
jgi:hypothetical protein